MQSISPKLGVTLRLFGDRHSHIKQMNHGKLVFITIQHSYISLNISDQECRYLLRSTSDIGSAVQDSQQDDLCWCTSYIYERSSGFSERIS